MSAHDVLGMPSPWVMRFVHLMAPGGAVLDLACGFGRHARALAALGFQVTAVDRDATALDSMNGLLNVSTRCLDLEPPFGQPWPLLGEKYDAIVVTNYLWRPRLDDLLSNLSPTGVLIYETFAAGNEAYGKPSRPDFLLKPDELFERAQGLIRVVAFEQGAVGSPQSAVVQRLTAVGLARVWPPVLGS